MRSSNRIYNKEGIFFITSTIVNWNEIFVTKEFFSIIIDAINYHINEKNLTVYAYVIMKNHFHLVCKSESLSRVVQSIKSYTAKKIIELLERNENTDLLNEFIDNKKSYKNESIYQIWQEGFYPKEILEEEDLKQKINYIHYNPVKAGYCKDITEWNYSSAGFYFLEKDSLIPINRIV